MSIREIRTVTLVVDQFVEHFFVEDNVRDLGLDLHVLHRHSGRVLDFFDCLYFESKGIWLRPRSGILVDVESEQILSEDPDAGPAVVEIVPLFEFLVTLH